MEIIFLTFSDKSFAEEHQYLPICWLWHSDKNVSSSFFDLVDFWWFQLSLSSIFLPCHAHHTTPTTSYKTNNDITFQIFGTENDGIKFRDVVSKMIERGRIGNITIDSKYKRFHEELSMIQVIRDILFLYRIFWILREGRRYKLKSSIANARMLSWIILNFISNDLSRSLLHLLPLPFPSNSIHNLCKSLSDFIAQYFLFYSFCWAGIMFETFAGMKKGKK